MVLSLNPKSRFDQNCEGSTLGKQHRNSFLKKNQHKSSEPLEIIHSNVCGPMSVNSVGCSRYFVTFIDDYSRYTTVYMIKHKSEVLDKFKEFVELAENHTGKRVKILRSDNGIEYNSEKFTQ